MKILFIILIVCPFLIDGQKIAVIGSGLGGCASLQSLGKSFSNLNVTLFEQKTQFNQDLISYQEEGYDLAFQLGDQFFNKYDTKIQEFLKSLNYNFVEHEFQKLTKSHEFFNEFLKNHLKDQQRSVPATTVAEWYGQYVHAIKQSGKNFFIMNDLNYHLNLISEAGVHEQNALSVIHKVLYESNAQLYVKDGLHKLFDKAMMDFMYSMNRLKVNLETNVTKITVMEDGKIELVYYFGGDKIEIFDAVIIATPLEDMPTKIFNTKVWIQEDYLRPRKDEYVYFVAASGQDRRPYPNLRIDQLCANCYENKNIYKIISQQKMIYPQLVNYFELEGFKIITEHKWVQKNIDLNETFGNNSAEFMLSPGLYYINSMDSVYSKMEQHVSIAQNIVQLIVQNEGREWKQKKLNEHIKEDL